MSLSTRFIPVRSQRRAMDWSLVLLSQDIGNSVEFLEETGAWALAVESEDYDRALAVIRQYQRENQAWPWQRELALPDFVFDAGSLLWVLLLVAFFALEGADARFRAAGVMDLAVVSRGEWWRLVTAVFLHANLAHLASNAAIGFVLLGLAMGRFGTGLGALAALLAGAGGNLLVWLEVAGPRQSLGASGMVMGALGLLAAQSVALWRKSRHAPRYVLMGVLGGTMLFVLLGLTPGTDVLAHAGGFFWGLLLGFPLALGTAARRRGWINLAAGLGFAALVMLAWALALAR